MENNCVCCGAVIPEGRQVCPKCNNGAEKARKYYDIREATTVTKARYHYAINVENGIKRPLGLRGCITMTDGKILKTAEEVREFLRGQLALGRKYLPCGDCDNFDYQTGCKGHPKKEVGSEN